MLTGKITSNKRLINWATNSTRSDVTHSHQYLTTEEFSVFSRTESQPWYTLSRAQFGHDTAKGCYHGMTDLSRQNRLLGPSGLNLASRTC
jgi:hypothetical protein